MTQCAPAMSAGMPTISWSVTTRWPSRMLAAATSASPAPSDPRVCTTARGASVVPDVNTMSASSPPRAPGGRSIRDFSSASPLDPREKSRMETAPRGTPGSQGPE
jgi:hypothetical protein